MHSPFELQASRNQGKTSHRGSKVASLQAEPPSLPSQHPVLNPLCSPGKMPCLAFWPVRTGRCEQEWQARFLPPAGKLEQARGLQGSSTHARPELPTSRNQRQASHGWSKWPSCKQTFLPRDSSIHSTCCTFQVKGLVWVSGRRILERNRETSTLPSSCWQVRANHRLAKS